MIIIKCIFSKVHRVSCWFPLAYYQQPALLCISRCILQTFGSILRKSKTGSKLFKWMFQHSDKQGAKVAAHKVNTACQQSLFSRPTNTSSNMRSYQTNMATGRYYGPTWVDCRPVFGTGMKAVAVLQATVHPPTAHTHPFNGPLSGTTRVSRYQKGKTQSGFY